MDDGRDIRRIRATVTLGSEMERLIGILGVASEEKFEEGVNVLPGNRTCVDGGAVRGVGVTDVDGLVQEDDVSILVPTVRVMSRVETVVGDTAWAKLEEESSGRRAPRTPVEP